MPTPEALPTPGTVQADGVTYTFCVERQLWRLPVGTVFEDYYHRQVFEKVAEILTTRGEARHVLQCLASPFQEGAKLGPICSAFFCTPGMLVYRGGSLTVFVRGTTKESHAQEA